jgi:hypothetical protein
VSVSARERPPNRPAARLAAKAKRHSRSRRRVAIGSERRVREIRPQLATHDGFAAASDIHLNPRPRVLRADSPAGPAHEPRSCGLHTTARPLGCVAWRDYVGDQRNPDDDAVRAAGEHAETLGRDGRQFCLGRRAKAERVAVTCPPETTRRRSTQPPTE